MTKIKQLARIKRHKKIRKIIVGDSQRPRFSVFRSLKHVYVQLIDDKKNKTLISANDFEIKNKKEKNKTAVAYEVGKLIAEKSLKKNIKKIIFDRGGYKYHGRVKALAQGARDGGLEF